MGTEAFKHDVFAAIADPNRRKILRLLAGKEMPIASITTELPITRTAVNKHLRVLAEAGLVRSQKVGREMRYTLQPAPLLELKQWLSFYEPFWDNKLSMLKHYIERAETQDAAAEVLKIVDEDRSNHK